MRYGLRRDEVKRIIKQRLNNNPDIFYYIEIDYIEELVELLSEGVADAIEENNRRLFDNMNMALKSRY